VPVNRLRLRPTLRRALGLLAEDDRFDAGMLTRFGLFDSLVTTPHHNSNLAMRNDLLALRRKLVAQLGALRKTL